MTPVGKHLAWGGCGNGRGVGRPEQGWVGDRLPQHPSSASPVFQQLLRGLNHRRGVQDHWKRPLCSQLSGAPEVTARLWLGGQARLGQQVTLPAWGPRKAKGQVPEKGGKPLPLRTQGPLVCELFCR